MNVIMEIRPGEGGDDAKLLVQEQARIYLKMAERSGALVEIVDDSRG